MWEWIEPYAGWILALSIVTFVGTLVTIPILLVRMPEDYFVRERDERQSLSRLPPAVRIGVRILKNVLGLVLVLAGLAMSIPAIPGQGLLTILIGITLLDLPGKRRLELGIVRQKRVRKAVNWIRAKAGRNPLQLPQKEDSLGSDESRSEEDLPSG